MPNRRPDLLLCGGGVIGLSIALQCARKGWQVTVLERGQVGMESSWAGAGILPSAATIEPLDPLEQLRALSHPLQAEWAELLRVMTGIDTEYRRCGGLYLGRTLAERATLAASRLWWDEHEIPYERLVEKDIDRVSPGLGAVLRFQNGSDPSQAWWMPNDCRVRNPLHMKALKRACESLNVQIIEGTDVQDVVVDAGTATQVITSGSESFEADRICITAGAWSQKLLAPHHVETGILPVRGQMVLYKLDAPLFGCVINDGHRYLMPRDDGHVLAGSCEEEVGFDKSTTEEKLNELASWAQELVTDLVPSRIVNRWAGLRPGSFDGYPYLGQAPAFSNLFIASGHFRHGLHWSTGTALLMQQLMFGEPTAIDLAPFRILRGFNSK